MCVDESKLTMKEAITSFDIIYKEYNYLDQRLRDGRGLAHIASACGS